MLVRLQLNWGRLLGLLELAHLILILIIFFARRCHSIRASRLPLQLVVILAMIAFRLLRAIVLSHLRGRYIGRFLQIGRDSLRAVAALARARLRHVGQ